MNLGPLILVLSVVVAVVLFSLLRGRGGVRHRPEVVQNLLYDIRLNQALVEVFHLRAKPRKFEKTNWEINKSRIGFLADSLKETLRSTFAIVEELNQEIKRVRKDKTLSYRSIDVSRLVEPLAACRKGLEGWMMENVGTTELPPRYPSITGFLFGER